MTKFAQQVLAVVSAIPIGQVSTYKIVADLSGYPRSARAVGLVLKKNKFHFLSNGRKKIPCHRVIKSNGQIGGFSLGFEKKKQLLHFEGLIIKNNRINNFEQKLYYK
ncbi:hypothetical protein A2533_00875 [Candidatus Falkowbacteria bacterium RIFOXYD2_FULL_35_9]|uniref:Methylated-DNA-[protein]-cysteine S-methyltransferase DNA binding domain-containing protein n=1 Tax=Candidatus Falkowbacteria bacterium RIFOXYC2_FULL_36_12 TaxID=1798002 RepID=A0A1F5SYR4_9BACT|nr:MAG: hypothetical protein A2300_02085 [Candidatus Falkowbacteria bacterium RIFOXYB2_FULL_35_7]OGF31865.1 MAG: hypothetical protein A2478_05275 [Candidatus Falkowbacteria bacterium RIFOXYC2_FULL_36_12]OGF33880.1 MAG: hypothetical protein A2223_01100 [Candidatus Falkowbacteria bacterium RIFOXYA2_FULL_35_8]OGF45830.1 MAG: hypothetical protein A2533_00875 [Candidatus Falkowbacteria bacterium RIFOXYD2_FULL_35_9]